MKKMVLSALALSMVSVASAQLSLPFTEDFESGTPNAAWDTDTQASFENGWARTGTSTLSAVGSDADWRGSTINVPAGGGSFMGKLEYEAGGYQTVWRMLGDGTNTDFQVSVDMYVPYLNDAAEPDDYLYHGVYLYPAAPSTTGVRVHSHQNQAGGSIPAPRFRIGSSSFNPTTPAEGWTNWVIKADHTNGTVELDVTGAVTLSTGASAQANLGSGTGVGVGMFIDGVCNPAPNGINGPRDLYFDNFSVTALTSNVSDWVAFE